MKIPYLKKKPELKSCHDVTWEDNYSWIHQKNILEVLRDKNKLLPEVKDYLEEENKYTDHHLENTKPIQKKLFDEIKGRIKLDDESLPYKDHTYEYWTKTTKTGNYSIKLRKKINSDKIELSGDKWKQKVYIRHTGYPGGQRKLTAEQLYNKSSTRLVENAVRGMLPKNKLGAVLYRNLKVFSGSEHTHEGLNPTTIKLSKLK